MPMQKELKYYADLSGEEKKKLRELCDNLIKLRKSQKNIILNTILKPIEDSIANAYNVTHNSEKTISINEYVRREAVITKFISDLFGKL